MRKIKHMSAHAAWATAALTMLPSVAWADDKASLINTIHDASTKTNDLISAIALGIAGLIAACALASIMKEIVVLLFSHEKVTFSTHIAACVKVIGICAAAALAVVIINGAINLFQTGGINLGSITGLS